MPATKQQMLPLTGIRFLLALWVVIFHQTSSAGYLGPWMSRFPAPVFCVLRTGYLAVGLFFVLSGFILSYNYPLDERWSGSELKRFAIARFARIYPAYAVGLLLVAPFVVHFVLKNLSAVMVGKQSAEAILTWTLLQAWIPQTAQSWNGPGWSLSVEAFFYCCFPFVGLVLWRLSRFRHLIAAGLAIWAAALIAPLVVVSIPLAGFGDVAATTWLQPTGDRFWSDLLKFDPLLHLPQFCVGILIGRAYCQLRRKSSRLSGRGYWLYVPGIVLEVVTIADGRSLPYPLVHNGLLLPLHALVILGFALGGGLIARILSLRPIVFLGNASYSMYILHAVITAWIDMIAKRVFSVTLNGLGAMVVYLLVVVVASSALFVLIEEPANRALKKRLVSRLNVVRQKSSGMVLQDADCPT